MRPIPVRLLMHTADLNNVVRDDYGAEKDVLAARLERVRIEPSARVVTSASGQDVQCVATLFVDARASWPQGVEVETGQSLIWEGRRYRVADVARLYDDRRLHHLEVELTNG